MPQAPQSPPNLTLMQLQALRREVAAIAEGQKVDREQAVRFYKELSELRNEVSALRSDVSDLRNDMYSLETNALNRGSAVLEMLAQILDRLGPASEGEAEAPSEGS